jgi:hypothetical protein
VLLVLVLLLLLVLAWVLLRLLQVLVLVLATAVRGVSPEATPQALYWPRQQQQQQLDRREGRG